MKYAICNETFTDWEWERMLDCVARLGYDGVEVAPFTLAESVTEVGPQRRRDLRRAAQAAGVPVVGLHWLLVKPPGLYITTPDDAVRRRTAEYFVELARFCADLGGRVMVVGSPKQRNLLPGVTRERAFAYAREVFEYALPEAERCGVTIAIEPLTPRETNFITTAADGVELVEAIGHPRFKLHLDVKAMSGSETRPLPEVIRSSARHLAHFHANDPNLLGPGMGEVDHRPILRALRDAGYGGYVSVEVFDYRPGAETIARQSIHYLRQAEALA
ncbi:MAG TPA: sugar phosphate isomerase/epimerase family protein [Planctomycetota bacterium]|nr:sugar phosphate isomerase/epimerase family protein [Planctomycetota bacterium]